MAKKYHLSEQDRDKLRRHLDAVRRAPVSTPSRRPERHLPQTPDVFAARVGDAGIAALGYGTSLGSGTGTGSSPELFGADIPGSLECDIYRLAPDGTMEMVPGLTRTVYNLSQEAVPANSWAIVARDKFNTWWVVEQDRSGRTIHLWANCRMSGSSALVLASEKIILTSRVAQGEFLFLFSEDFLDRKNFTVCGIVANNDYFYEDYSQRTQSSCVMKTASGTDPVSHFGITVHGRPRLVREEEGENETGTGTGSVNISYPCQETYCVSFPGVTSSCEELASLLSEDHTLDLSGTVDNCNAWSKGPIVVACDAGANTYELLIGFESNGVLNIQIGYSGCGAFYQGDTTDWDGITPLSLVLVGVFSCPLVSSWPATITIYPGPCADAGSETGTGTGTYIGDLTCCPGVLVPSLLYITSPVLTIYGDISVECSGSGALSAYLGSGPENLSNLTGWFTGDQTCSGLTLLFRWFCGTDGSWEFQAYEKSGTTYTLAYSQTFSASEVTCDPFHAEAGPVCVSEVPDGCGDESTQWWCMTGRFANVHGCPCDMDDVPLTFATISPASPGGSQFGGARFYSPVIRCGGSDYYLITVYEVSPGLWSFALYHASASDWVLVALLNAVTPSSTDPLVFAGSAAALNGGGGCSGVTFSIVDGQGCVAATASEVQTMIDSTLDGEWQASWGGEWTQDGGPYNSLASCNTVCNAGTGTGTGTSTGGGGLPSGRYATITGCVCTIEDVLMTFHADGGDIDPNFSGLSGWFSEITACGSNTFVLYLEDAGGGFWTMNLHCHDGVSWSAEWAETGIPASESPFFWSSSVAAAGGDCCGLTPIFTVADV